MPPSSSKAGFIALSDHTRLAVVAAASLSIAMHLRIGAWSGAISGGGIAILHGVLPCDSHKLHNWNKTC